MAFIDCFEDEMTTAVVIKSKGDISSTDANGQPVYAADVTKYNDFAAVWQLSSSQIFANDRIGDPSTHQIVLKPASILFQLVKTDFAEITLNGKAYTFDLNVPDDVLGLGELTQITGNKRILDE